MTLKADTWYAADIGLGFIDRWASNAKLIDKLNAAGFRDVTVIGFGGRRTAWGKWVRPTLVVSLPPQVKSVHELTEGVQT
jgi:hypothetical protein